MDPVGICRLALGLIGADPIDALDAEAPSSREEQLCARLYPQVLRSVLEASAWTFATEHAVLEPFVDSGIANYPRRVTLPARFVRVLQVGDGQLDWAVAGRDVLVADALDSVDAEVIRFEEDATKYSAAFVDALAARLAWDLAMPLADSRALSAEMRERYLVQVRIAGALDGSQGAPQQKRSSWLRHARG